MSALQAWWSRLPLGAKVQFFGLAALIVALAVWLGISTMRPKYDVLFSRLADSDAASIAAQLRQLKIPYRLADEGATIEVVADQVHETRLRLMSSGVPLSGAVGFEIFDKQGLGMTDQSQRVSYQRALQGELARTISSIEGVKQARVHLVMPDSTLFKRDKEEARAAVSLTLKPGTILSGPQILGVQRLIAASVAGLDPARIVVTDQRGIALSGDDSLRAGAVGMGGRLQIKREIEDYVIHKVAQLLDSTYGPGQAIVSADVSLNFDEIRRTVQDLLPVRGAAADRSGGIRHKHQTVAAGAANDSATDTAEKEPAPSPSNSTMDIEYEYGRSVEQVIAAPGGITRLSVGVVVPGEMSSDKQKHITDLVRMAAGINEERGDAIVVLPLDQLGAKSPLSSAASQGLPAATDIPDGSAVLATVPKSRAYELSGRGLAIPALIALLVLSCGAMLLWQRARGLLSGLNETRRPLSAQERQQLLMEIQRVVGEGPLPESRVR